MNVAHTIEVDTPRSFALALLVFLVVVTFVGFMTGTPMASGTARMLEAAKYSGATLSIGLALGFTVWGVARLIRGALRAPDIWETAMSLVTVVGVISAAIRMFR